MFDELYDLYLKRVYEISPKLVGGGLQNEKKIKTKATRVMHDVFCQHKKSIQAYAKYVHASGNNPM